MIKSFRKALRKKNGKEKAQVLVILAIVMVFLIALIGIAIDSGYYYVSYSRLRRATDAAALAATGEFKKTSSSKINDMIAAIHAAARQQLRMNGVNPDDTSVQSVIVDTCYDDPGNAKVCGATTPEKIVYVKVVENVPTFFLSVVGYRSWTLAAESYSQAASVDVALVLDTSESMTDKYKHPDPRADPSYCNKTPNDVDSSINGDCWPFSYLKTAAMNFANNLLFYPYDRMAVIDFNQFAYMDLPMSSSTADITNAINNLQVYEGIGRCPYTQETLGLPPYYDNLSLIPAPPPVADPLSGLAPYTKDPGGPCRFWDKDGSEGGSYLGFDCPMMYSPSPDPSRCGSTNIADAIAYARSILGGNYTGLLPLPASSWPQKRNDSLWVMVLLTDGTTVAAFDNSSPRVPICPKYTWTYVWHGPNPQCNDNDPSKRHSLVVTSPNYDPTNYDADDFARDEFDGLANNTSGGGAVIFTVGLGKLISATGAGLLEYPSLPVPDGLNDGAYAYSPDGSGLTAVFLGIANKIATRISQ